MSPKREFPTNFLWGSATSSHQVEGGLKNNWSLWEKENAKRLSESVLNNRPWFLTNEKNYNEAIDSNNYISGIAADSYNRYKEDVKILKELGLKSYRFSVDWSRIEPEEGVFSKEGLAYYKSLVEELKKNDIEPFITCWHWTFPVWIEKELEDERVVEYFERYVSFLVENLGEDVKHWGTINEPMSMTLGYLLGLWPPGKKNIFSFFKVCGKVLVDMHKVGYRVIKDYDSSLQVSFAQNNSLNVAYRDRFLNKIPTKILDYFWNYWFLDKVVDYMDYISLNFYMKNVVSLTGRKNPKEPVSDMGWYMEPRAIGGVLKNLRDRYDLPIYITENGLADREDKYRSWWIDETVLGMLDAIEAGVDLRGYMYWSLLDNFEWAEGFWPRFGLVEVNRENQDRRIRGSAYHYSKIVKKNGII